jgi:hypothetical protein
MALALGLRIDAEHLPQVADYFARLQKLSALLDDFPLPPEGDTGVPS